MYQIAQALQQMLLDNLAPMQALLADAAIGATVLSVANSSRFRRGDQILLVAEGVVLPGQTKPGATERAVIRSIPDYNQIELETPLVMAWTIANDSYILGAVEHIPLKRVYIGGLPALAAFPCITITGDVESNDWMTLHSTDHTYKFNIKCFTEADDIEKATRFMMNFAKKAREVLLDHIHPIVDGVSFPLTQDLPLGSTVVSIPSTALIVIPGLAFIRDAKTRVPARESILRAVLSPTEVEITVPTDHAYLMSRGAEFILMYRYLYDTRPDSIKYGFLKTASAGLLMGADISYFAKENLCRDGNILT